MNTVIRLCLGCSVFALSVGCTWLMPQKEQERIPQPPPGPVKSSLPHNQTQRFEAEATLGPLATPRR